MVSSTRCLYVRFWYLQLAHHPLSSNFVMAPISVETSERVEEPKPMVCGGDGAGGRGESPGKLPERLIPGVSFLLLTRQHMFCV